MNKIELFVFQYEASRPEDEASRRAAEIGLDWVHIEENYAAVDVDSYPGFTQIQKYELFLAHFSTSRYVAT